MADAEGDMVRWALSTPSVEKRRRAGCEADPRVGVADLEGRPRNRFTFGRGGPGPCGQQRVADDQTGGDTFGDVAPDAAVVIGEPVQLEVLDQTIEPDRDTR